MTETTLDFIKRHLDLEMHSGDLHPLPVDFYSVVSRYSQTLRRSAGAGNSEVALRLISRQTDLISSMVRQLFDLRVKKVSDKGSFLQLLPEERYVCSLEEEFQQRSDSFMDALSTGKPSFIEFAHRNESARMMVVRFVKHTNEIVGADLKRYGPFEENDVASIPASNATVLIAGGDAVEVYVRH